MTVPNKKFFGMLNYSMFVYLASFLHTHFPERNNDYSIYVNLHGSSPLLCGSKTLILVSDRGH
jgi:hypothetical protein